ncbi:MAG: acyl carrier protein [Lachnospiraceae bacterium]|nr:acyl carrier protein [Lachnospiraceae bacterium]
MSEIDKSILKKQIIEIIKDVTNNTEISNDINSLISDAKLDSLNIINVLIAIEEKYNIDFNINDDINLLMNDINLLVDYIYKRIKNYE